MRLVYLGYTFNCTLHLDKDPFWSHLLLFLNRSLWGCWTCCGVNKLCRHHWGYWTGEKVQFHFNLTHLILEDSCVEMLIVQTTGTWLSARDQQLVCCDWLQSAHLSHWLSRRQAGSFNFQVISLRGCVILSYFLSQWSDLHDATRWHGTDRRRRKVLIAASLQQLQFRAQMEFIYSEFKHTNNI